jgi:predicted AlkP superfamily pyrophosphatase or phosphodiesterase
MSPKRFKIFLIINLQAYVFRPLSLRLKKMKIDFLSLRKNILAAALALLAITAYGQSDLQKTKNEKPYVIMVSFDGFRYDYAEKYEAKNLQQMGRENVQAESMIPSFPTKTFPNHYTLVTGMYPQNHQLVSNSFYKPSEGSFYKIRNREQVEDGTNYGGTPLWVLAEQQGMKSACFFWVGSEAEIQGVRPSYYYRYDSKLPYKSRVQQVLNWLNMPEEDRPQFITLYFSEVDSKGHRYGPDSKKTKKAVQEMDELIGFMREEFSKLDLPINLIITSDHGMVKINTKQPIDLNEMINLEPFKVAFGSNLAMLYHEDKALIKAAYQMLKNQEKNFRVFLKEDFPDSLHFSKGERIGDILLLSDPPYIFGKRNSVSSPGTHGFNPYRLKEMHTIFYAEGPAFKKQQLIPSFENIHVYPLIAEILGLEYDETAIDGKLEVLEDILVN